MTVDRGGEGEPDVTEVEADVLLITVLCLWISMASLILLGCQVLMGVEFCFMSSDYKLTRN